MSEYTTYLLLIYVFEEMEKVVMTFRNDYLHSDDIQYFNEKDIKDKIAKGLPASWISDDFQVLEVTKIDYNFSTPVK